MRHRWYTRATHQGLGRGHCSHSCTMGWSCPCFGSWKHCSHRWQLWTQALLNAEQIFWLNDCIDVSELLLHLEDAQMAFPPNLTLSHGKTWEWMSGPGSRAAYVLESTPAAPLEGLLGMLKTDARALGTNRAELCRFSAVLWWAMKQLTVLAYEHLS